MSKDSQQTKNPGVFDEIGSIERLREGQRDKVRKELASLRAARRPNPGSLPYMRRSTARR